MRWRSGCAALFFLAACLPTAFAAEFCSDSCWLAKDGVCSDGGLNSESTHQCDFGTDCEDCGSRAPSPPPSPLPPQPPLSPPLPPLPPHPPKSPPPFPPGCNGSPDRAGGMAGNADCLAHVAIESCTGTGMEGLKCLYIDRPYYILFLAGKCYTNTHEFVPQVAHHFTCTAASAAPRLASDVPPACALACVVPR